MGAVAATGRLGRKSPPFCLVPKASDASDARYRCDLLTRLSARLSPLALLLLLVLAGCVRSEGGVVTFEQCGWVPGGCIPAWRTDKRFGAGLSGGLEGGNRSPEDTEATKLQALYGKFRQICREYLSPIT